MFWLIIISLVVLVVVAYMIYTLPADAVTRSKKKKERIHAALETAKPVPDKDWKTIAERWEKNNAVLLGDIERIRQGFECVIGSIVGMQDLLEHELPLSRYSAGAFCLMPAGDGLLGSDPSSADFGSKCFGK